MNTKKLILAAGLGLSAIVAFTLVKKLAIAPPAQIMQATPQVEVAEKASILVAKQDIPFGTRITEEAIGWDTKWPADSVNEDYINQQIRANAMTEIPGSVVRAAIYAGEPITDKKIVRAGDKGLMAALIKPGMRAVTTRISVDTAAGGFIQPGDRVDIIMTSDVPNPVAVKGQKRNNYVATTVFANVHVLAIDQTYTMNPEGGAAVLGSTATFELSQPDAELLQQITAEGDISLTLRGIDNSRVYTPSAARVDRSSGAVSTLTVYRGGQPQQVAIKGQ